MSRIDDIDTLYALSTGRKPYFQKYLDEYEKNREMGSARDVAQPDEANLISSEIEADTHMPVIDCDYPIVALPSSTPGHFHLYIDKPLTWQQYRDLLEGMFKAGLIQEGWYKNALKDGRTYVRLPNVHKKKPENGKPVVYSY